MNINYPPPHDPLANVVEEGIKGDIRYALEGTRFRAAIILTFAGIDAMAFLGLPVGVEKVSRKHFMAWCAEYIRLPGPLQLTPDDLYGARCGIVHTYGSASELTRAGAARHLLYSHRQPHKPPVMFRPDVDPSIVIVSVEALVDAFFAGIDRFLFDVSKNEERSARARRRFGSMYHLMPSIRPGFTA